eukprot:m51a1_g8336 putative long chain acyl- synthetase peroxisomal-like (679) ;mRNA; r:175673-178015
MASSTPNFVQVDPPLSFPDLDPPRDDEDYDKITLFSLLSAAYTRFATRPCLGHRSKQSGEYEWCTYAEMGEQCVALASFLAAPREEPATTGGAGGAGLDAGGMLAVLAPNSPEWLVTDHACLRQSVVSVPLYSTLGPDAVAFILRQTALDAALCDAAHLRALVDGARAAGTVLRVVVVFGPRPEGYEAALADAAAAGARVVEWEQALAYGRAHAAAERVADPSETASVVYTSGTTGDPKGVVLTGKVIATASRTVLSLRYLFRTGCAGDEVHLSYLPLAHVFERQFCASMLREGAAVGFLSGSVAGLFDDIAALRPTFLIGVPRVWKRLRDNVTAAVEASGYLRSALFNYALYSKACRENGSWGLVDWDSVVFGKLRQKLGGRCHTFISGGAALSADMSVWLTRCFCVRVLQGYGLSETMGGVVVQMPPKPGRCQQYADSIGLPHWRTHLRLVDVPELGYLTHGDTEVRGEVWIQAPCVFKGYYKDPERTREALAEVEGAGTWLRTGDVGRLNADGSVTLFDRTKSVFKLSQGEYVAAEYLETLYSLSPLVAQVWIHGDSTDMYVSAVVCPNRQQLCQAARVPEATTMEELCALPAAREAVRASFEAIAKQNNIPGFQRPRTIVLDAEGFTNDNDLATPTFKFKRAQLRKKFGAVISNCNKEAALQQQPQQPQQRSGN